MPRYSLRALLILLAILPPMLALTWTFGVKALSDYRARQAHIAQMRAIETAASGVSGIGPWQRHPKPAQQD